MATFEEITRHTDFDSADVTWVSNRPPATPIAIVDADPSWPEQFDELSAHIRRSLGDCVLELDHVGSTSVPGLPAKPVIDIDLTVADSTDEAAYIPALEGLGFVFLLREPGWHGHRLLKAASPLANLHVWGPDCPEVIRHRMFRDWLRQHSDDRARYAEAKWAAASAANIAHEDGMAYNERKQPIVRQILDDIFRAHGML
jgi:GrpB-like predicted nucleotidyltransferase (UPF0157 family)